MYFAQQTKRQRKSLPQARQPVFQCIYLAADLASVLHGYAGSFIEFKKHQVCQAGLCAVDLSRGQVDEASTVAIGV